MGLASSTTFCRRRCAVVKLLWGTTEMNAANATAKLILSADRSLPEVYREANAYARSIYEQFFKLATMSFAFNAAMLAALGYLLKDQTAPPADFGLPLHPITALGFLGAVYNIGALLSYNKGMLSWLRIGMFLRELEKGIVATQRFQKCFPVESARALEEWNFSSNFIVFWRHLVARWFLFSVWLWTNVFFAGWIVGWGIAVVTLTD